MESLIVLLLVQTNDKSWMRNDFLNVNIIHYTLAYIYEVIGERINTQEPYLCDLVCGWIMMFNTTFNNISAISWRSVLLVEETRVHGENHRPVASHWQGCI
jgi:hypothetical protein